MRILAIDTATTHASVALRTPQVTLTRNLVSDGFHSTTLMGAVNGVLGEARLTPQDLGGIVITVGPGSFTGLRVGIATAQGIALGAGCSIVPVGTLEALAQLPLTRGGAMVVAMDAFRGEVFSAAVRPSEESPREIGGVYLTTAEEFVGDLPSGALVVGNVVVRHEALLRSRRPDVSLWDEDLFLAASMAALAPGMLEAGRGVGPGAVRVDYGRGAHIGGARTGSGRDR